MAARLLDHVLPSNGSDYERLLASQVDQILALDADEIRRLWNPETCDLALLPYLAWAMSCDLWDADWPEAKKRYAVAQSFAMHRMKGTQDGIAAYLELVDCALLKVTAPPATTFATAAFTTATRLAWLAKLPQVRIYPYWTARTAPADRGFYSRPGVFARSFMRRDQASSDSFMQTTAGPELYGRRATFVDDGVEVPANYEVLGDPSSGIVPERVFITSTDKTTAHYGQGFFGSSFMQDSKGASNVMTVQLDPAAAQQFSSESGLDVVNVNPIRIFQERTAPVAKGFLGAVSRQRFLTATDGPRLIYDAVYLLDPDVLVPAAKVKFFYGYSRFGIAPFTAELLVDATENRPKSVRGTFYTGFMQKSPLKKLNAALEAIQVSKSLRDTILVDTQVYRPVELADSPQLGTFQLGQLVKVS